MDLLSQPHERSFAPARGLLVIHTAPTALTRHVEWALAAVLGSGLEITWQPQSVLAGTHRTSLEWRDRAGAGAQIASSLRGWHYLRFELWETTDSERTLYRYTPELGIHRAEIDGAGAILISENQIKSALLHNDDDMREELARALGTSWDLGLDQFRRVELEAISQSKAV